MLWPLYLRGEESCPLQRRREEQLCNRNSGDLQEGVWVKSRRVERFTKDGELARDQVFSTAHNSPHGAGITRGNPHTRSTWTGCVSPEPGGPDPGDSNRGSEGRRKGGGNFGVPLVADERRTEEEH